MNDKIRRILVAIRDPKHVPVAQLRKSAALARASGASIELLHVIEDIAILDPKDREPLDRPALKRLQRLERSSIFKGLRIHSHIARAYPAHEGILERVAATRADLVVTAPRPRTLGSRLVLRNTDWELIRHCPCQLLLIKSKGTYAKPGILTAIDPYHSHAKPVDLDPRLLRVGQYWARHLKGEQHVFHAFLPLAVAVPMPSGQPMAGWIAPEIEALHASDVTRAFQKLANNAGIEPAHRHLSVGDVRTEIKRTLKETNARIVIMGAISRSALTRLFIGNTAERLLDDLACDVLVVKPPALATQSSRIKAATRLRAA